MAVAEISSWLHDLAFVALRLECVVESLLSTGLCLENVVVLSLELARRLFLREHFLYEGLLSVLVVDPAVVELGRAFDDGSDVAEGRYVRLGVGLLVVSLRVEHVAHLEQLQVASQLRRHVGLWHVEPVGARGGSLLLCEGQRRDLEDIAKDG